MGGNCSITCVSHNDGKIINLPKNSPLMLVQNMQFTSTGTEINQQKTDHLLTRAQLQMIREDAATSDVVSAILLPSLANVAHIANHVYLTGISGVLKENIRELNIALIIGATHEIALGQLTGVESIRVPVEDSPNESIFVYLDDVSNLIYTAVQHGQNTMVFCIAGNSRAPALIMAYLIKFKNYSLKRAFKHVKSLRPCTTLNAGFFAQLILYEHKYRKRNSVMMRHFSQLGKTISVPDFYQTEYPELYELELQRQLQVPPCNSNDFIMPNHLISKLFNYIKRDDQFNWGKLDDDVPETDVTRNSGCLCKCIEFKLHFGFKYVNIGQVFHKCFFS